jgi:cysteine desulfurase
MLKVISSNQVRIKEIENLRNQLEAAILNRIDGVKITGIENPRLVNTSHMTIEGIDGETLLMNLDLEGFHVSTGAACSSGNPEPSPVLLNMGFTRDQAQSSLRVSLGWGSSYEEIERFSLALEKIISRLREIKHGQKYFNDQKQTSLSSYERGR